MKNGGCETINGRCEMKKGCYKMINGRYKMKYGRYKMINGKFFWEVFRSYLAYYQYFRLFFIEIIIFSWVGG
jgi:hypothetical protein